MKSINSFSLAKTLASQPLSCALMVAGLGLLAFPNFSQAAPEDKPYKIINTAQTMGTGRIDYVYADSDGRRLYIPRGSEVLVFDLDTLKSVGVIPNSSARGAAVDPKSHHGFCSSSPVTMWDTQTLQTIKTIDVQGRPDGKGHGPGGLGLDIKNHILFAFCHEPATAVILNADDGKIITTLPIGNGTDGGGFNPSTMEAFSSQGDGTLTIIKETSPTTFEVEQTVTTKARAKTCTLDTKNNQIVLITTEPAPASAAGAATPPPPAGGDAS